MKWQRALRALAPLLLVVAGLAFLFKVLPVAEWTLAGIRWIEAQGPLAFLVFFIAYVVLAVSSFPSTPLNIVAGVLFPFWIGALLASGAGLLASVIAFLLARYVARDWFRKRLEKLPRLEQLLESMEDQGAGVVFLTRLNPLIPASLKNYGFALTDVPLWRYALESWAGHLPILLVYVYLGWAGGAALLHGDSEAGPFKLLLFGLAAFGTLGLALLVRWRSEASFDFDETTKS